MFSKNQLKTVAFLATLTGLLLLIGSFWGKNGLLIAFLFSIILNFGSYWFSDKIVLSIYRAKKLDRSSSLYGIVREIAQKARIPTPEVYILPYKHSNAFATGRSPKHSAIAFTEGILKLLNKEELKGVISHEIAHIKNRDTLIQTTVATIAGAIAYIAFMIRWAAIFGGFDEDDGLIERLILAILAPLIAIIIQLAISRSREFLADEKGVKILQNREALISALAKLEKNARKIPLQQTSLTTTTSNLFIVNPFSKQKLINIFSTHPPIEERIKRLRNIKL